MRTFRSTVVLSVALCLLSAAAVHAQPPAAPPATAVLVNLTVKPDIDRSRLTAVLPDEVRATVKLYLDGKIQQWYSRADGRGVMFILNGGDVAAAKATMETLPLSKAGLATLDYTALGPLMPLRLLMAPPADGKADR